MYKGLAGYHVKSAGTSAGARIRVTEGLIGWADWIFAMEKRHVDILREKYRPLLEDKLLVSLKIPDDYEYMDAELIEMLKVRLSPHIEVP
jgi:predicted protein tyrosine phosphatase